MKHFDSHPTQKFSASTRHWSYHQRLGMASPFAMLAVAAAGLVGVTSAVVAPQVLITGSSLSQNPHAEVIRRHAVLDMLGKSIRDSLEILDVSTDANTPYFDVTLWVGDHVDPGTINRSEIAVLSYNRVLGTLTRYQYDSETKDERDESSSSTTVQSEQRDALTRSELHETPFCDHWRTEPHVRGETVETNLSDVTLNNVPTLADEPVVEFGLKWTHKTADGSSEYRTRVAGQCPGNEESKEH